MIELVPHKKLPLGNFMLMTVALADPVTVFVVEPIWSVPLRCSP